jgi:hypothetical protein
MAHFAQINDQFIVLEVVVINNQTVDNLSFPESEPIGVSFCQSLFGPNTNWKQTSYNGSFRKNYAGIGYMYDPILDGFISPRPYPSWVLDTSTCDWQPPIPYPDDGKYYYWDESTQSWILIPSPLPPVTNS